MNIQTYRVEDGDIREEDGPGDDAHQVRHLRQGLSIARSIRNRAHNDGNQQHGQCQDGYNHWRAALRSGFVFESTGQTQQLTG